MKPIAMFRKCDPAKGLWLCDVCLKTEIEPPASAPLELRKMWVDEEEQGIVLCEECISQPIPIEEGTVGRLDEAPPQHMSDADKWRLFMGAMNDFGGARPDLTSRSE